MSASQIDTLIKMINQIAANLSAYPTEEAAERIMTHLQRFWPPQMRQQLILQADAHKDALSPMSKLAVQKLSHVMKQKTV